MGVVSSCLENSVRSHFKSDLVIYSYFDMLYLLCNFFPFYVNGVGYVTAIDISILLLMLTGVPLYVGRQALKQTT